MASETIVDVIVVVVPTLVRIGYTVDISTHINWSFYLGSWCNNFVWIRNANSSWHQPGFRFECIYVELG